MQPNFGNNEKRRIDEIERKRKCKIDIKLVVKRLFILELISIVFYMKRMGLTPETLFRLDIFPRKPYSRGEKAKKFFKAAQNGDVDTLIHMLRKDRFLVFEYDHVGQSALHRAAKND